MNPANFIKLQRFEVKGFTKSLDTVWFVAETIDGKKHLTSDESDGVPKFSKKTEIDKPGGFWKKGDIEHYTRNGIVTDIKEYKILFDYNTYSL